jgi:AsmA protein
MTAARRTYGIIAAIVVVVVVLLAIGVPAGLLASKIQQRVERETGYRLAVKGSTRVGLWPSLHITLSDVSLQVPNEIDTGGRLTIGSIKADLRLASLWSGQPEITDLVIDHPVANIPLRRERRPVSGTSPAASAPSDRGASGAPTIRRITVTDGTVILFNSHDRFEQHIDGITAEAIIGADRQLGIDGHAEADRRPLNFKLKASLPDPSLQRQTVPAELTFEAPGLLPAPLSSKAEIRINGTAVMINGLSGTIGDDVFDGWASVDFASKPLIKLDLDFRRLDIAATLAQAKPDGAVGAAGAWSTDRIALVGLNYVDAQLRLSAAELDIGRAHLAPVALEASLANGILKSTVSNLGAYGGLANGTIDVDASPDRPVYAMRGDLTGIRALPLLSGAAGFDKLDGRLQAKIDVRSIGESQQAIMSNLAGTVVADFRDGTIKGLNVAQMIRSLTSGTLSGWPQSQQQSTDLTQLSASFRIEKGQAHTTDLNLVGPLVKMSGAGVVDLGAETLALRVEPKLAMTTQGQGRTSDPVAFGIPVVIDGPWTAPRIYPDVAGIAPGSDGQSSSLGTLGQALGNLIQQGLSAGQNRNAPNDAPPQDHDPAQPDQGSRPMTDMLKQFFGR